SGNSYKVRLALARLGIPYSLVDVDILKGESRTPEFLTKNPNGQVPLLEVAPGQYLSESNAILWHLVSNSPLRPEDRIDRARALPYIGAWLDRLASELGHVAMELRPAEVVAAEWSRDRRYIRSYLRTEVGG